MKLPKLIFPEYEFNIQTSALPGQSLKIFDIIRKKYVTLTPEEWVRQHLIHFMVKERKFPQSLLSVEKKVRVNNLTKRTDVVVYSPKLNPILLAECKAPSVVLTQKVFDQTARYNMTLGVNFFLITNGLKILCSRVDHKNQAYIFLEEIPFYQEIKE